MSVGKRSPGARGHVPLHIAIVLVLSIVAAFPLSACMPAISNQLNDQFSYTLVRGEGGSYYVDSYGQPIVLIENKNATDPTYQELVDFLNADLTDLFPYDKSLVLDSPAYLRGDPRRQVDTHFWLEVARGTASQKTPRICSDFAQMLHNNAEIQGIRAGYVSITLAGSTLGHAIDAFNTTDRGLVFIDDTGSSQTPHTEVPGYISFFDTNSWDKVAYLEAGQPYHVVSLSVAGLYGFEHADYSKWLARKQHFDSLMKQYDVLRAGRESVPKADYERLQAMMDQLKQLSAQLGGIWEGLGVVTGFGITWGDSP